MRKIVFALLALLTTQALFAQKLTGVVKDQQGKGLDKTTVSLLRAKDSSVAKLAVSDAQGKFSVEAAPGQYLVSFSHVGYIPQFSKIVDLSAGNQSLGDVVMEKAEAALQGVTVTSQRPVVEVKADKTILNVEGTINAVGQDALELLRKSPGVIVDKDDNLSLAGKNGVQVYIDGKPTPLSGAD
ncbi:MAG: carboxypeptidase regulatory-like domain-containing protein, partial [Chitinophagaceae bacterium]|nr:carboxypeptidase regulatory-like domain-containing protein [Chitinophagaceae bacterium]